MTRALVTGGTGFTGQHLVRRLLDDGEQVRVIARSLARARAAFGAAVEVIPGDVADAEVVDRAVAGCASIYHLATAYRQAGLPDERYRQVHVASTRLLLDAARRENVSRVVHCSTVGVLGHIARPPADETSPHAPGDIYQATKSEGERLALEYHARDGLPVTIARPTAIYGPGDLRLLKLFELVARRRPMIGSGDVFYHMVHVHDLIEGFRLLARHPEAIGEVFILGGEGYRSLDDIAAIIARTLGVERPRLHIPVWPIQLAGSVCERLCAPFGVTPPLYRRRVDFFTKSRAFSIEKAKRVLGYRPQIELERGIQDTAAWYREHGYL